MASYCSRCGGPIRQGIPDGDDRQRDICQDCGEIHYVNPKIVVGAVCEHGDQLLLCRRAIEPRTGYWTIPAGYMEIGETAEQGAIREAWEEARARIEITGLIASYSVIRPPQVQLLYRAVLLDAQVAAGPESLEVGLFTWDTVPWEELAFTTVRWVLERALELRDHEGDLITVGNPA